MGGSGVKTVGGMGRAWQEEPWGFIPYKEQRTHWARSQLPVQGLCPGQHVLNAQLHGQFIDVLQEGQGKAHALLPSGVGGKQTCPRGTGPS